MPHNRPMYGRFIMHACFRVEGTSNQYIIYMWNVIEKLHYCKSSLTTVVVRHLQNQITTVFALVMTQTSLLEGNK